MRLKHFLFVVLFLCTSLLHAKTIVFLNGGPGFNSEAERKILTPYFDSKGHEAFFWNEPSQLRPQAGTQLQGMLLKMPHKMQAHSLKRFAMINMPVNCLVT